MRLEIIVESQSLSSSFIIVIFTYASITQRFLGATHADEVVYLFYVPQNKIGDSQPPAIGTDEFKVVEALRSMWTNFAKTG